MRYPEPLVPGRLVRRYKRFLADCRLDSGEVVTAHCPNTGALAGLDRPDARVWLSRSDGAKRKLAFTLEQIEADGVAVGINTMVPNRLTAEALAAGRIVELGAVAAVRREVRYGTASRVDFVVEGADGAPTYLEVKNVHLRRRPGLAEFPDCVTDRGRRHLEELARLVAAGTRAANLFVVQRPDAERFRIAEDFDPAYAEAFRRTRAAGVAMLAYACRVDPTEIVLERPLLVEA